LENAQRVLNFQVQNIRFTHLEGANYSVARLAAMPANVEARAAAVKRAVLPWGCTESPLGAAMRRGEAGASPAVQSFLFDPVMMDKWTKHFGEQLRLRVWETLEHDVEVALEQAVDKARCSLFSQGLPPESAPGPEQEETAGRQVKFSVCSAFFLPEVDKLTAAIDKMSAHLKEIAMREEEAFFGQPADADDKGDAVFGREG
jgi:hypothetical protein